jgi:putative ABC transport system permease protein
MILLIATLNFINLSTARSVKRMKEVGVRKVAGAQRQQLVTQFVSESVLITAVSMAIAVVLAEVALPYLNQLVEKELSIDYQSIFSPPCCPVS